jgi:hypothetical protein
MQDTGISRQQKRNLRVPFPVHVLHDLSFQLRIKSFVLMFLYQI